MVTKRLRSLAAYSAAACLLGIKLSDSRAADQPAGDEGNPNELQEIVVTAERREARQQDVPVSITAYTAKDLEAKQLVDVTSLGKLTPNMATAQAYNPGDIRIQLRGITELVPQIGSDPAVGVYVDGVYHGFNPGLNIAQIDMDRAEILKGPQGTLFGRNTIGGALNITTKKPTDQLEGFANVAFGNYDTRTYSGVLNLPLVEDLLAVRFTYQHDEHSGYGRDTLLNQSLNDGRQNYARAAVRISPSSHWEILLSGEYSRFDGHSALAKLNYFDPTLSLAPGVLPPLNQLLPAVSGHPGDLITNYIGGGFYDNQANEYSKIFVQTSGFTTTVTGSFDAVSIKSITNFTDFSQNDPIDTDGTPYALVDILDFPARLDQLSEELQAFGDGANNRLKWITGLYFYTDHGTQQHRVNVLSALSGVTNDGKQTVDNKSYATFAQLTYEILPSVRLTGGVRYTKDTREMTWFDRTESAVTGAYVACALANQPFGTDPALCSYTNRADFHYVPWTAGIDYKPVDDTLLYAKVSKGFRSGGFSQSGPPAIPGAPGQPPPAAANATALAEGGAPFAPENLLSPEVGVKWEGLNHRLRVNAAAFYSDYRSIQLSENLPAPPGSPQPLSVIRNVGNGRIYGGELDTTALLGKLLLTGSLGLLNPKYTTGPNVGQPFINTSKVSWSAGAEYPVQLPIGLVTTNIDYSWRSKLTFFSSSIAESAAQIAADTQSAYGLLDARIALRVAKVPMTISVYGRNLTNKQYYVQVTDYGAGLGADVYIPGLPRLYGASLQYDF